MIFNSSVFRWEESSRNLKTAVLKAAASFISVKSSSLSFLIVQNQGHTITHTKKRDNKQADEKKAES